MQVPTGKISHKRYVRDRPRQGVCSPPFRSCATVLYRSYGSVSSLDLQVSQDVVCYEPYVCHQYIDRPDSPDPKVRSRSDDLPLGRLAVSSCVLKGLHRVYAVTGKRRPIAVALAMITTSQLALGIYGIAMTATHSGGRWTLGESPMLLFNSCIHQRRPSPQFRSTPSKCASFRAAGQPRSPLLEFH